MGFEEVKELAKILKEKDNFLVATHLGYDNDALGSLISLGLILEKLNKNFLIYLEEDLRPQYKFLPLQEKFIKEPKIFDVAVVVDCDRLSRAGENFYSFIKDKFTILIDHHQTNIKDADFNLVMNTNSTAEIIYYLAKELKIDFDKDLATAFLLGILGDTLILTVEMEKEQLLENFDIVKDLIEKGGDYYLIIDVLKNKDWDDFKKVIEKGREAILEDNILFLLIEDEENTVEDMSNFLSQVRDAKIIIVFQKREKGIKISLRSKGNIDVGYLAKNYFNGGGHQNAAGGYLEMDLGSVKNFVLEKVKEYLKNVN